MKTEISQKGSLTLTAETPAELLQLNHLLNGLTLTESSTAEGTRPVGGLNKTKSIALQLQTSVEAEVAEVAVVVVAADVEIAQVKVIAKADTKKPEEQPEVTLEVTPIIPVQLAVVVNPPSNA